MVPVVVTHGNLATGAAARDGQLGRVKAAGGGRLFCVPFSSATFEFCISKHKDIIYLFILDTVYF